MASTDVAKAVALIEIGTSYSDVADIGKSKSTIYRNVRRCWRQTGEYVKRRDQGRKRSTKARDDRFIVLQTLLNRRKTVQQLRSELEEEQVLGPLPEGLRKLV